jgi:ABC-type antimicrobial peptide transport system permease subunit
MSYFNAGVGDTVSINGTNMTIKGIYYSSLQNKSVYMSIADSELVLGMDNGSANTLNVFAVNISAVDNVTDTIRYYYPNFTVEAFKNTASSSAEFVQRQQQMQVSRLMADAANQTKQLEATRDKQVAQMNADLANQVSQLERDLGVQVNQSKEDLSDQVNQSKADQERQVGQLQDDMFVFQTVGNLIIGVSAITAALIVFFMMFYAVRERTREIGVLKALGFTGGNILTGFLVEGMAIGFLGGFVGTVIALAAGRVLSDYLLPSTSAYTPASPDMPLVLVVLALSTVLGALGSLYPAWTASRKSAVEAMHNV